MEWYQNTMKYFSKHPFYNAMIHFSGGIGIGVLVARPFDSGHPLQLALIFIAIAVVGHLIPMFMRKIR